MCFLAGRSIFPRVPLSSHGLCSNEFISKPTLHTKVSATGRKVGAAPASGHFYLMLLYTQLPYFKECHVLRHRGLELQPGNLVTVRSVVKPCMSLFHTLSALLRSLNCEMCLITSSWSSGMLVYLTENNTSHYVRFAV